MGFGVVTILVAATGMVFPEQFDAINPFNADGSKSEDEAALASPSDLGNSDRRPGITAERIENMPDLTNPPMDTTLVPESGREESSSTSSEAETTHTHKPQPPAEDPSSEDPETTGSITGDACPCTVTGTVELKGEVNLKGDLMVKGGTLVARPGVRINGNRFQIAFMGGGKADFRGSQVATWSGNGSNANLKRDIEFRNLRRIMFHDTAPSVLSYISVIDSGTLGVEDDYPLHWHFSGDSSRGTVVEGVVVLNGQNHAYVPHASHGITFRNIMAKNTLGTQAFWWNTTRMSPCPSDSRGKCTLNDSHNISVDRALIDGVTGPGTRIAAFAMGQGNNNSLTNSVTRNVGSSASCSGYLWDADTHGDWFFSSNTAMSGPCERAIFHWQNREDGEVIQDFKSNLQIDHGAYRNTHEYRNIDVPIFVGHALGYTVRDSRIGHVILEKHPTTGGDPVEFINVTLDKISVRDAQGDSGVYIFDETNITCGEVQLESAHSASKVIVNGVDCTG